MNDAFYYDLKACLQSEVIRSNKPFSWLKACHRALKHPERRFYFWWRIAAYWYKHKGPFLQKRALRINANLRARYGSDIKLGAQIGVGFSIAHYVGIVISERAHIGQNFHIKQNVTIGVKHGAQQGCIYIGDNVEVGANSCIIGDDLSIGNNVHIGAMTFVNKDVPNDCVVYNRREMILTLKNHE